MVDGVAGFHRAGRGGVPRRPTGCGWPPPAERRAAGQAPRRLIVGLVGATTMMALWWAGGLFAAPDNRSVSAASAGSVPPQPRPQVRDISSRDLDPAPLSAAEVFPGSTVDIGADAPPYRVLASEVATDCARAARGPLVGLLAEAGCNQVVRGTLRSADGGYLVTAGIVNLTDEAGANGVYQQLKALVDARRGGFAGMVAGPGTAAVAGRSLRASWHIRGHYLVYGVLARTDGTRVAPTDRQARRVLTEVVNDYLRGRVLGQRAVPPES